MFQFSLLSNMTNCRFSLSTLIYFHQSGSYFSKFIVSDTGRDQVIKVIIVMPYMHLVLCKFESSFTYTAADAKEGKQAESGGSALF